MFIAEFIFSDLKFSLVHLNFSLAGHVVTDCGCLNHSIWYMDDPYSCTSASDVPPVFRGRSARLTRTFRPFFADVPPVFRGRYAKLITKYLYIYFGQLLSNLDAVFNT